MNCVIRSAYAEVKDIEYIMREDTNEPVFEYEGKTHAKPVVIDRGAAPQP